VRMIDVIRIGGIAGGRAGHPAHRGCGHCRARFAPATGRTVAATPARAVPRRISAASGLTFPCVVARGQTTPDAATEAHHQRLLGLTSFLFLVRGLGDRRHGQQSGPSWSATRSPEQAARSKTQLDRGQRCHHHGYSERIMRVHRFLPVLILSVFCNR